MEEYQSVPESSVESQRDKYYKNLNAARIQVVSELTKCMTEDYISGEIQNALYTTRNKHVCTAWVIPFKKLYELVTEEYFEDKLVLGGAVYSRMKLWDDRKVEDQLYNFFRMKTVYFSVFTTRGTPERPGLKMAKFRQR